jgi:hypothetical protein
MIRPKTGFKQKNPNDLTSVNFDDIEKYVDLLYEKPEEKIKGARNLLYLIQSPNNIYMLCEEQEKLLDVISRTLRDEHKKILELSIYLIYFFYAFSQYQMFHPLLLHRSVGEICMAIIDYNLLKYDYRRDELIRFSNSNKISPKEYQIHLEKFLFLVRKQDRLLTKAFQILHRLAEDPKVEVKMVKKGIVNLLLKNMGRININLLLEVLLFLKKLSIIQVNKDAMIKGKIFTKMMKVFEIRHPYIWAINLQIFFNLSFDRGFRMEVIKKPEAFYQLTSFFKLTDFRSNILRIFYNFSLEEKALPLFYNSEAIFIIYELLDKFPEKIIGAELAALTLNLIAYPPNAQKLAENGRVKNLIERVLKNSDFELMKIIKVIIENCNGDKNINKIYNSFLDDHFMPIIFSNQEIIEYLIETIYILSYIETDWSSKLEKFKLIDFFEKNLKTQSYDEFLLAVISFFGNVAKDKGCSSAIAKSKILPLLNQILVRKIDSLNIVFSIILSLYQMLPWKETREIIIKNEDLIKLVLNCLKCQNEQINFISMRFLEIIQIFDAKWSEKIKKEKFRLYNNELINKIKEVQNKLQLMNDYIEQGGLLEDGDDLMAAEIDEENLYMDENGYMAKYPYYS